MDVIVAVVLAAVENPGETVTYAGAASVVSAVISSAVWAYVFKRREDRRDRQQEFDEDTAMLREWKEYAARMKSELDQHREQTTHDLEARDSAINELKRRNDRCEHREKRLRRRVDELEDILGVSRKADEDSDP